MITASFCHSSTAEPSTGMASASDLPYDLSSPDEEFILPNNLKEVSGLTYYRDREILCVQDEKANVYTYDLDAEEVSSTFDFGKDGDFEGITIAGTSVFVVRSDGRIYEIEDFGSEDPDVETYNTPLSGKNNAEGLAWDQASDALLVACKDSPEAKKDQDYKGFRAVYRFDLAEKDLEEEPFLLVELGKLDVYRKISSFSDFSLRIALALGLIDSKTGFHPSAIAIHPLSGEIYMISSKGKIMVILDRKGSVLHMTDLDPGNFSQPEGLCFSPEGDLFISNEGKGGRGTILKFTLKED